jgi:hypothetical protein
MGGGSVAVEAGWRVKASRETQLADPKNQS